MRTPRHRWSWLWMPTALVGLGLALPWLAPQEAPQESAFLRTDPVKIVASPQDPSVPCGDCHTQEAAVWASTPHATGFADLHTSAEARAIRDRLGGGAIREDSRCLRCHYTAVMQGAETRAIAGVSCESCHGAARDWLFAHKDYGDFTRATEPDEHRRARIQRSVQGGMLRPSSDPYAVTANCFECHTVPDEELVNVGGHPSGSSIELLTWADAVRHNFLPAQWGEDAGNRAFSAAHRRVLYALGQALDFEYSLRALAAATEPGVYAKAMEQRAKDARRTLEAIAEAAGVPEFRAILGVAAGVPLAYGQGARLTAAADRIRDLTRLFGREADGAALAALDPLLPGAPPRPPVSAAAPARAAGTAAPPGPTRVSGAPADDRPGPSTSPADDAASAADPAPPSSEPADLTTPPGGAAPADAAPPTAAPNVTGARRSRPAWHAADRYRTLGPSAGCSCHNDKIQWWNGDAHFGTAAILLRETAASTRIATAYGLSADEMKRGDQICMSCHGTVVSGEESRPVSDGVSCESCHGAGSGYQYQHQSGDGYAQGASLGMKPLERADARAQNCASCHHITDERLLSAGHPAGQGFDLASRNALVQHWQEPVLGDDALNAAYGRATGSRPLPANVTVAERTTPRPTGTPGTGGAEAAGGLGLAPLPAVTDSTATPDLLLLIKRRLEALYRAAQGQN
ncbi:MAG: multiheme c-type cytochrome [Rhodothermales bacterium]|nr:multiheme c-type cytochrome [Rhodothermales bacterium]